MASIYLETSVIGYLASRPGADIIFAANQLMTLEWWNDHRARFNLYASQAVVIASHSCGGCRSHRNRRVE